MGESDELASMRRVRVVLERANDAANLSLCVAKSRGLYRAVGLDVSLRVSEGRSPAHEVLESSACLGLIKPTHAVLRTSDADVGVTAGPSDSLVAVAALPTRVANIGAAIYSYLVAGPAVMRDADRDAHLRLFLAATALGFRESVTDPTSAAHDWARVCGLEDTPQLIEECENISTEATCSAWGHMDAEQLQMAEFLISSGLIAPSPSLEMKWTNKYLPGQLAGKTFEPDSSRRGLERLGEDRHSFSVNT